MNKWMNWLMNTPHSSWEEQFFSKQKLKQQPEFGKVHVVKCGKLIIFITWFYENPSNMKGKELKRYYRGFPGGTVVKNPPANAGDTGLSPGPGRSHMPRSN